MADAAADADADAADAADEPADAADEPDVDPDGAPAPAVYGRIGADTDGSSLTLSRSNSRLTTHTRDIAHCATQLVTVFYRHVLVGFPGGCLFNFGASISRGLGAL